MAASFEFTQLTADSLIAKLGAEGGLQKNKGAGLLWGRVTAPLGTAFGFQACGILENNDGNVVVCGSAFVCP